MVDDCGAIGFGQGLDGLNDPPLHFQALRELGGGAQLGTTHGFLATALSWQAGEVGGAPIYAGMTNDGVDFVINPELAHLVPVEVVEAIAEARARIRSGEFEVPRVLLVEGEAGGE